MATRLRRSHNGLAAALLVTLVACGGDSAIVDVDSSQSTTTAPAALASTDDQPSSSTTMATNESNQPTESSQPEGTDLPAWLSAEIDVSILETQQGDFGANAWLIRFDDSATIDFA